MSSASTSANPSARLSANPSANPATDSATPIPAEVEQFIHRLRHSLADDSFVQLTLGRPHGAEPSLDKLLARRVVLRGVGHLSLVWRHRTKDITKNLPLLDAMQEISRLVQQQFAHAHLVTRGHDTQLALGKKGQWGLRIGKLAARPPTDGTPPTHAAGDAQHADTPASAAPPPAQPTEPTAQDRRKQHALALHTPFLAELGITDAQHRLVPAMARKWRQINKFVEVLAHAIGQSPLAGRDPALPVRVLDFGAGKGYLTFAVQHQLQAAGRVPEITGIELRDDLTTLCNAVVARLGLAGLRFETGDVGQQAGAPTASTDIMIALHACDTATDVAMHRGVRAGAAIILCSPCCHKELRPQMTAPPLLQPMLRHGIHMTEQAEMLTDALRALLLQAEGYDAQVFEFISPEHTGKNKMVLAVRRAAPPTAAQRSALWAKVADLKAYYGVSAQTLDRLLAADRAQAGLGGTAGTTANETASETASGSTSETANALAG